MHTLIKRSMKLGLAALFICAAIIPACAQLKPIKPIKPRTPRTPRTGSAGTVVHTPQTPVVSPTTSHAATTAASIAAAAHTIPSATLNAAVTRAALTNTRIQRIEQRIQSQDIEALLAVRPGGFTYRYYRWEQLDAETDFTKLVTLDMPDFIPIENISINPMNEDAAILNVTREISRTARRESWNRLHNHDDTEGITLVATFKKIDNFFFTEHDGRVYIKKSALRYPSYGSALKKLGRKINSGNLDNLLATDVAIFFIQLRNRQIIQALDNSLRKVKPQTGQYNPQADPTTQSTAEEIQFLLENLPEDNPLRQDIETMLRENGYIAPVETPAP